MIDVPEGLADHPAVVGVGIDVVDVGRMATALERTAGFATRVFTDDERSHPGVASLAARFAAKEAVLKALGAGIFDLPLRDIEITGGGDEPPGIVLHDSAALAAESRGVGRWLVSLTHDGGVAAAVAVALAARS